jgi:hypothetical protein
MRLLQALQTDQPQRVAALLAATISLPPSAVAFERTPAVLGAPDGLRYATPFVTLRRSGGQATAAAATDAAAKAATEAALKALADNNPNTATFALLLLHNLLLYPAALVALRARRGAGQIYNLRVCGRWRWRRWWRRWRRRGRGASSCQLPALAAGLSAAPDADEPASSQLASSTDMPDVRLQPRPPPISPMPFSPPPPPPPTTP